MGLNNVFDELLARRATDGGGDGSDLRQWAEANVVLGEGEGRPGPLRFEPWQHHIVDRIIRPDCRVAVLQLGTQVFKSLGISLALGYGVCHGWRSMAIYPTGPIRDKALVDKFKPLHDHTPDFARRVKLNREGNLWKDGLHLEDGGMVPFAVSTQRGGMQSAPARLVIVDEVDLLRSNVAAAANPFNLIEARVGSYNLGDTPLGHVLYASTPSLEGMSLINRRYLSSTMWQPNVLCVWCGERTPLGWDATRAREVFCMGCARALPESEQASLVRGVAWLGPDGEVDGASDAEAGVFGWQASRLLAPVPWSVTLGKFDANDVRGFTTQVMGRVFNATVSEPVSETDFVWIVDGSDDDETFADVMVCDFQRRNGGELVYAHVKVKGTVADPRLVFQFQRTLWKGEKSWAAVIDELHGEWESVKPDVMFLDGGDYAGGAPVEELVRARWPRQVKDGRVKVIRGQAKGTMQDWYAQDDIVGKRRFGGSDSGGVMTLNVPGIKIRLMEQVHEGRIQWATGRDEGVWPADIVEQLLSESLVSRVGVAGVEKHLWQKKRGVNNETWDFGVYTNAAISYLGADYVRRGAAPPINLGGVARHFGRAVE